MTTQQILEAYPVPPCETRAAYQAGVRASFAAAGVPAVDVSNLEDSGGNCLVCGEAGRCPGYHTPEELDQVPAEHMEAAQ